MTILLTGCAGFIGMHVAQALLARGETVVGVDNLNDYYSVALKRDRLARLAADKRFAFHQIDVADRPALERVLAAHPEIDRIVHLAAQAGVRYSLTHPETYIRANIEGQFALLEAARARPGLRHVVYASSSSVYGGNTKLPFSVEDRTDHPVSLYAATKKSCEVISHCYADLFRIPLTGLRFFTVYGPWGRPDMSAYLFTDAILKGEPIHVFNHGRMRRDFTYIDDIVAGVLGALDRPPPKDGPGAPHRLYNLGNHRSEALMDFIATIERAIGRKATIKFEPMQPGDVPETYADIESSQRDLGFQPTTSIAVGIPKFVEWFRKYHAV
ncbi:MAG: NAD-dependent epimerase/dehydratase family protein [Alphaproteobacteria bacterium]